MTRINTSRQTIAARQRVANYHPTNTIAPHVLASTIVVEGLVGEVIIRRAGRTFTTGNGLVVRKGERCILVASKFAGRYYVLHDHKFSTNDLAVQAKLRAAILKHAA